MAWACPLQIFLASMLAFATSAPIASIRADDEVVTAASMSVAGQCFLAMCGAYFFVELMLYIVEEQKRRGVEPGGLFDKIFASSKLNAAKSAMPLVPVLGILMLFIMFRISKLDQDIYDPLKNEINPSLKDSLPNYRFVQAGYILSVGGIYLQGLNAFDVAIISEMCGNLSEWVGMILTYVGYGIIVYGCVTMRDPNVPLSVACQCLLILASIMFVLQFLIKFLEHNGLDLVKGVVVQVPIVGGAVAEITDAITTPTADDDDDVQPVVPPPQPEATGKSGKKNASQPVQETTPLMASPEADTSTEENAKAPPPAKLPDATQMAEPVNLKALHPGNLMKPKNLALALSTTTLIPTFMILCFFVHFRLKEAMKFNESGNPVANTVSLIQAEDQMTLDEYLAYNDKMMFVGAGGIALQVASKMVITPFQPWLGTVASLAGLVAMYASYGWLGFFAYAMKPIVAVAVLCGIGLVALTACMQVVIFVMSEVSSRYEQFKTLQQVLLDMLDVTGFANILAILMLYIHYRGKLLVLSGFTVEITQETEMAMFGAAGSVVAQMAIVILSLGKAKIPSLGDLCLFLVSASKICMYVSFGHIVYSCVTLGSK